MDLSGKAVLMTGARRIGARVAGELQRRGARVALSYRRESGAPRLADAAAGVVVTKPVDLTDAADCRRLVDETAAELGRLDVLINMASVYDSTPVDELDASHWDRALAVDARAAYLCALAAVPHLRASGGGRIVNVADWVAASGRPRYRGYLPYYVAKSAVVALTEALALELAGDGILVNAVAPGTDTSPGRHGARHCGCSGARDAAGPLGRRRRDRPGGAGADRDGLRDRRDAARGRRTPPALTGPSRPAGAYCTWTAVPLTLTISMLEPCPTTS